MEVLQSRLGGRGFLETRLKAALRGAAVALGGGRGGGGAQLEDLLMALAERRSFPDTRLLVARGTVGDTCCSAGSPAAPAATLPLSAVLVLPVKEPVAGGGGGGGGGRGGERQRQQQEPGG